MRSIRQLFALLLILPLLAVSAAASGEKTVLMTFTGDVTLGGQEKTRGLPDSFDSVAREEGYDYFFANFSDMFAKDDLTVINLEGVLADKIVTKTAKKYNFRGKTAFVEILTRSNIDAASLSNNHIGDYGKAGENSTKQTLDEHKIAWFQGFTYYLYRKDGVSIAFFALDTSIVYNKFDRFKNAIRTVKESGEAGAVVVCWHTGKEYVGFHEKWAEQKAGEMVECGTDLIIINHSHVAQGMSIINNRCVFYSLGNFVFGGNSIVRIGRKSKDQLALSLYGMVVQVKFTFSDEGQYLGQQPVIHPVYSSGDYPVNNYQPKRLTMEEAAPVLECIRRDTAFELPPMTEKDGFARIELSYLPAFDGVMLPEENEQAGPQGIPEAASPVPTRENKDK